MGKCDGMICDVGMVIYGGGDPEVIVVSFPKFPTRFINILHCASWMAKLVSVDDTFLLVILSLSLGSLNRSFIVLLLLKWTWNPALTHTFFETFTKSF